jgi:hypothetical protein
LYSSLPFPSAQFVLLGQTTSVFKLQVIIPSAICTLMTRSLRTPTKNYCIRVSQTFCKSFTELHSQIEMIPHPEKLTDHWIQGDFLCATPRGCISDSLLRQQWSSGHPTLAGGRSRPRPRITTTTSVAMMKGESFHILNLAFLSLSLWLAIDSFLQLLSEASVTLSRSPR